MRTPPASLLLAGLALLPVGHALADSATNIAGSVTTSTDGKVLYTQICQGCHMADGKGAIGAATIPALAGNPKLKSSGYPVYVVLNGYGAMPWFSGMMSDAQIASVVNYVRTNFGNHYTDTVNASDVAAVRGPNPTMEK